MSLLDLGNTKKRIPTSMKKKRHLGILDRFGYWWILETFLLSTSRKTTKGASNLPMCRAKHGVKLLDHLTKIACSIPRCFFQVPSVSWRTIMCIIFDQLKWFCRTTTGVLGEVFLAFRGDEMVAQCFCCRAGFLFDHLGWIQIWFSWSGQKWSEHLHPKDVTLWLWKVLRM